MSTSTDSVLETLDKIATVLNANATVAANFSTIGRIISPRLIPPLDAAEMPAVLIAPVNTIERWHSSARREVNHVIEVYVVNEYWLERTDVREIHAKIKMAADALRNERLAGDYLSRPIQIEAIDYDTLSYGDENRQFLYVGTMTIDTRRLFIGT